jgi:hypothetical protein
LAPDPQVIVDSTPPGAKILRDGKVLAETPESVSVPSGKTVTVVLHKEGFVDETIVVDPSKGRKLVVKLDHAHAGKHAPKHLPHLPVYSSPAENVLGGLVGGTLGAPPATATPPPAKPAPPATAELPPIPPPVIVKPQPIHPKPGGHRPVDPYERIDDSPKKNADVLNPY